MRVGTVSVDGQKVRRLRSRQGWTQEDLARKTGCSKRTIENVEASRPVLLYTVSCIAQVFQITPEELVREDGTAANRRPAPARSALPDVPDAAGGPGPSPFGWRTGITQSEAFFNREAERQALRKYLRDRQCCQLVGPRRMGKTSLLRQLEREAAHWERETIVAYVDLQHPRCFTLAGWLEHTARLFGMAAAGIDLVGLSEGLDDLIAAGCHPVLCLDEFEELTHRRQEFTHDFFAALRSCGQRPMTIITGSQKRLIELTDARDPSSPFYNIFPLLDLGPFSEADAEDYVTLERPGVRPFSRAERRRILDFAGGHPLALQVACSHVQAAAENGDGLDAALGRAAQEMGGYAAREEPARFAATSPSPSSPRNE
jgi:transcriptional regulator with XRE-family HTH domain